MCAASVCSAQSGANELADVVVAESFSVAIVASVMPCVLSLCRSVAMLMSLRKFWRKRAVKMTIPGNSSALPLNDALLAMALAKAS